MIHELAQAPRVALLALLAACACDMTESSTRRPEAHATPEPASLGASIASLDVGAGERPSYVTSPASVLPVFVRAPSRTRARQCQSSEDEPGPLCVAEPAPVCAPPS